MKHELPGHDVSTVVDVGWSSKRNAELLALMVGAGFRGFVTVDKNLQFQQNIQASGIAVVVLMARTNRLKELRPLAPALLQALDRVQPGQLMRVGA
ncbi:MAG: hypothetical protein ACRD4T_14360 [Candidatus Acidiferrales bacterium]